MIIRLRRQHATARRRFAILLAAAIVVAAVCAFVVVRDPEPRPAYAATPAPLTYEAIDDAASAVDHLGRVAAAAGTDAPTRGLQPPTMEHLRIVCWQLHGQISGRTTTSAVVPVERESWRAPDNSGRVTARWHRPEFTSAADRRAWRDEGSPGADAAPRSEDYPAGQFPAMWPHRPPSDPALLNRWLQHNHNTDAWPAAAPTAISDLLRERVLAPDERAAVLRLIAGLPGVEFTGAATDRAGRHGHAFSIVSAHSGLPTRHTFIVDPATGRFLAYEQMLTTTAGNLNVAVPAVIGYETYLTAEHAAAL